MGAVPLRAVTGYVKAVGRGGGYWRLGMRLGRALGYGNAFAVESVQWGEGGGFKRFLGDGPIFDVACENRVLDRRCVVLPRGSEGGDLCRA